MRICMHAFHCVEEQRTRDKRFGENGEKGELSDEILGSACCVSLPSPSEVI